MLRILKASALGFLAAAAAAEPPCTNVEYSHGISYLLPLKYDADFSHFEYVNPDAPKGGAMRLAQLGTFDNYNIILEKGRPAAGYDLVGGLVYDRLMEPADDEPVSQYGRLAQGVAKAPDLAWIAFKLRDDAHWHDGVPITVDDVLFSFEMFQEHGSVALRTVLADLERVFAFGEREICFVRKADIEANPVLPFALGGYSIMPKHYWESRDISKTTVEPPLGSGPYRLAHAETGRLLEYERVEDYWGRDLPVNRGRYNFGRIKFDYFADEGVMLEAHKGDVFDVREEGVSKNWATQYNFSAVQAGLFKRELRPLAEWRGCGGRSSGIPTSPFSTTSACAKRCGCSTTSTGPIGCCSTASICLASASFRTRQWRTAACRAKWNSPCWSRGAGRCRLGCSPRSSNSRRARASGGNAATCSGRSSCSEKRAWRCRTAECAT